MEIDSYAVSQIALGRGDVGPGVLHVSLPRLGELWIEGALKQLAQRSQQFQQRIRLAAGDVVDFAGNAVGMSGQQIRIDHVVDIREVP